MSKLKIEDIEAGMILESEHGTKREVLCVGKSNIFTRSLKNEEETAWSNYYYRGWKIVKPTRKITLYRYTYSRDNDAIDQTNWQTDLWSAYSKIYKLLKTESKEIEVEV